MQKVANGGIVDPGTLEERILIRQSSTVAAPSFGPDGFPRLRPSSLICCNMSCQMLIPRCVAFIQDLRHIYAHSTGVANAFADSQSVIVLYIVDRQCPMPMER